MIAFANRFYDDVKLETFFESCGVADLITTCYGGRNRIAGEEFVKGKVGLGKLLYNRVGHLILRALAIRASNPQNALARISFHSPKNLPPPPRHSNHFSHLLFQLSH